MKTKLLLFSTLISVLFLLFFTQNNNRQKSKVIIPWNSSADYVDGELSIIVGESGSVIVSFNLSSSCFNKKGEVVSMYLKNDISNVMADLFVENTRVRALKSGSDYVILEIFRGKERRLSLLRVFATHYEYHEYTAISELNEEDIIIITNFIEAHVLKPKGKHLNITFK